MSEFEMTRGDVEHSDDAYKAGIREGMGRAAVLCRALYQDRTRPSSRRERPNA